jgi:two-component system OmpR family sensor kinase
LLARLDHQPKLDTVPADLGAIAAEMETQLRVLAQDREVLLELSQTPAVSVDRDKIKQVILNLFHNAVQHTDPRHGRIVVTVEPADGGAGLSVSDNGNGIPASQLPLIFDRFYRLDESRARIHGGTGLGLAISRSIVELHGGTIEAASEVGRGSAFRFVLPACNGSLDALRAGVYNRGDNR